VSAPVLLVCMGVSGVGKSTLARALADRWSLDFLEADDFHSAANRERMAAGKPLTDAMREPWIRAVCEALEQRRSRGRSCVLACSALRFAHRQTLRGLDFRVLFIDLQAGRDVIAGRMASRREHFAGPTLLDGQFDDLEPTSGEDDVITVDANAPAEQVLESTVCAIRRLSLPAFPPGSP